MDISDSAKKYEPDKIALLGLFALGLLIAFILTSSRRTRPLRAGREIIAQIKNRGISSFLDDLGSPAFFIIKNAKFNTIGFTMDVYADFAPEPEFDIQSEGILFIRGRYQQAASFKSDDRFDVFKWRTEMPGPGVSTGTELQLKEDGVLSVSHLGRNSKTLRYKPDPAVIPDFLLDLVFAQMREGPRKKVIVQTINADGKMVEVAVAGFKARNSGQVGEVKYTLSVDFENDPLSTRQVELDGRGRILRIKRKNLYIERAEEEDILATFPEWAAYILPRSRIPRQD
ncbi:MAG: hypothetical protein ACYTBJ_18860 [Planctomycetota bacterium]|jgi:hypothetical protein